MSIVNFAARYFRPLGLMQNAAKPVGKSTCKSTAVEMTRNYVESRVTGASEKDCSLVMVGNAYVAGKQNLSF